MNRVKPSDAHNEMSPMTGRRSHFGSMPRQVQLAPKLKPPLRLEPWRRAVAAAHAD
jgi:hypothetical protein